MPLRQSAREMRDVYANEIARAVHDGRAPDPFAVAAWARYEAQASGAVPIVIRPGVSADPMPERA